MVGLVSKPIEISKGTYQAYKKIVGMSKRTGYCWSSNNGLCKVLHKKLRTVTGYLTELERAGAIRRLTDYNGDDNPREIFPLIEIAMVIPKGYKNRQAADAKIRHRSLDTYIKEENQDKVDKVTTTSRTKESDLAAAPVVVSNTSKISREEKPSANVAQSNLIPVQSSGGNHDKSLVSLDTLTELFDPQSHDQSNITVIIQTFQKIPLQNQVKQSQLDPPSPPVFLSPLDTDLSDEKIIEAFNTRMHELDNEILPCVDLPTNKTKSNNFISNVRGYHPDLDKFDIPEYLKIKLTKKMPCPKQMSLAINEALAFRDTQTAWNDARIIQAAVRDKWKPRMEKRKKDETPLTEWQQAQLNAIRRNHNLRC